MKTLLKSAGMASAALLMATGISGFTSVAHAEDTPDVLQLALAETTDEATILSWADEVPVATSEETTPAEGAEE